MLQDLDWQGPGLAPTLIARLAERVPALAAVKVETAPAGPKYTALRSVVGDRLHLSGGWAARRRNGSPGAPSRLNPRAPGSGPG